METETKTAYQVPTPPLAKAEPKEVVYTAGPGDPLATTWHGHRFVSGVPVLIKSEHILGLVDGNPAFSFKGQDKAKEAEAKNAEAVKQFEVEREAVLKAEADEMTARHKREADAMQACHKAELDRMTTRTKSPLAAPTKEDPATGRPKTIAEVDAERSSLAARQAEAQRAQASALQAQQAESNRAPSQAGQSAANTPHMPPSRDDDSGD